MLVKYCPIHNLTRLFLNYQDKEYDILNRNFCDKCGSQLVISTYEEYRKLND